VLALSLGQSAVYSVVSIVAKITAPGRLQQQTSTVVSSVTTRSVLDLTYQLLAIGFALVPVVLALYFLSSSPDGVPGPLRVGAARIGLGGRGRSTATHDVAWGAGLAAVIGIPGLGLYFLARALDINATIVPSALYSHWWTLPVLVLSNATLFTARVLEHMRPLDPQSAERVRSSELDRIARRADRLRGRAPFDAREVLTHSRRERSLRRYLLAFGLSAPARLEPDRGRTDLELTRVLAEISLGKPRPSLIYVWSPTPDPTSRGALERALSGLAKRRHELRWVPMRFDVDLERAAPGASMAVLSALAVQAKASHERGVRALARLGIRVERLRSVPRVALTRTELSRVEHEHVAIDDHAAVDLHAHVPSPEHLPLPK